MNALREMMSQRDDGYWELLATAAGCGESVEKTRSGLTAKALASEPEGPAVGMHIVMYRVEALAAHDVSELVSLSREWRRPSEIDPDTWWSAAWYSSLRHLERRGAVVPSEAQVPWLIREARAIWGNVDASSVSWRALAGELKTRWCDLAEIRALAHRPLEEPSLDARDVEAAPRTMLRLLRGRGELLSQDARALLLEHARKSLVEGRDDETSLLVDLAIELEPAFLGEISTFLVKKIPSLKNPREIIPLPYLALGSWRMP